MRPNKFLLIAVLGVIEAVCASAQSPSPEVPAAAVASPTGEYLIGPGDTLEVFVWRQPELSVTVPVRPDGRLSTPLVEDVVAVGKTPSALAAEIETALSEYIRSPEVNVIVQGFVGISGEQIRVLGQAAEPKSVPFRQGMTLMDVIIEAGGLTEFAAGNRSRVVRTTDGKSEEIRVRLNDLINRGKLSENMIMRPGDVVIIPEAVF
jgi:polysaccharide biosynthesis/export protein